MKTLVAGIGSMILGDDGAGVHAARRLKDVLRNGRADVIEIGTAGLSLLDFVAGYDRLILIDAIVTGAPAGTVHELRGDDVGRALHLGAVHEADLPTTLALGRRLSGAMPRSVIVIAVEASDVTTFSERLTPEVEAALPDVIARIESMLG